MKFISTKQIIGLTMLMLCTALYARKGMLEKEMFYLDDGTIKSCKFWAVYFGEYETDINRKFPGEEIKPVNANINFNFLSSGYIEGVGYSAKGKINCEAKFMIMNGDKQKIIEIDSIDYIYNYGKKVKLTDGTDTDLFLNLEGKKLVVKKAILRLYTFTDYYGEKMLKEDPDNSEIPLKIFGFSKSEVINGKNAILKNE
ncbi:MAG: hypothetical protein GF350_11715 [Chitinivibrionales bacterium]|nr:hypothetical protein [Chitinivibrionales bacterium]